MLVCGTASKEGEKRNAHTHRLWFVRRNKVSADRNYRTDSGKVVRGRGVMF